MEKANIAIVGATGAVGVTIREILEERKFPVDNLYLLASERSAGERLMFNGKSVMVRDLADFDFSQVDVALFSAGGSISREYAPKAVEAGCVVVDNTSENRYDDDIPLEVTEVNPERIADYKNRGIIANPNCSTMQLMVALKPIQDAVGIEHINVCTYQAVSGSGQKAVEELAKQTAELLNAREATAKVYDKQIAFNVLPNIDALQDNGYTKEEMKLAREPQKILDDRTFSVSATAVRIPTAGGHSESVNVEFHQDFDLSEVRQTLHNTPGIIVQDNPDTKTYPMPMYANQKDEVFVGRIRRDETQANALNMWIVSDNLRKGAATNAIQIAEYLVANMLV